jgi:glycosyltransferase involved in cell wall biosynthesis
MLFGVRVVVVVPAFQEAERVGRVIATLPAEVDAVVVVDDASTDGTADAARAAGDGRVRVVSHRENRGVGAAIVTGYRAALADGSSHASARDAFVVMAGDAQMDPADLPALVAPIARGDAGYVKGDRFAHPDVRRTMPRARYAGGVAFSRLTSLAIGRPISDSQCGYTALARAACARLDLDALWPRYGYPNDLLAMLAARGVAIAEVPVRPVYAGEASGLRVWHCARIAQLCARAWVRRLANPTAANAISP